METDKRQYDHLICNLEKISDKNSIFKYKSGRKAFLSLGQGNISEWLESLLPNTRLIIEPRISGSSIGIQYINGELRKAINKNSEDITKEVWSLENVPKKIPVRQRIEIRGVLYSNEKKSNINNKVMSKNIKRDPNATCSCNFCAFQIFHCKINQFQALQELKSLKFEIPETHYTKFISDIEIYRECWKEGKIFRTYPTSGIVLKINSRKLQKRLGENNLLIHWAYAIN